MWWILTILFFLIGVVTSILLFYSLRRVTQYEDLIIQFQQIITYATERMKLVDSEGHYESDDETGFFFEELKQLQLQLDDIFENEENNDGN
tara:strand:- start:176 stop:448 length:273 start_codon:yes stop_codon:yes gene_type:complete